MSSVAIQPVSKPQRSRANRGVLKFHLEPLDIIIHFHHYPSPTLFTFTTFFLFITLPPIVNRFDLSPLFSPFTLSQRIKISIILTLPIYVIRLLETIHISQTLKHHSLILPTLLSITASLLAKQSQNTLFTCLTYLPSYRDFILEPSLSFYLPYLPSPHCGCILEHPSFLFLP